MTPPASQTFLAPTSQAVPSKVSETSSDEASSIQGEAFSDIMSETHLPDMSDMSSGDLQSWLTTVSVENRPEASSLNSETNIVISDMGPVYSTPKSSDVSYNAILMAESTSPLEMTLDQIVAPSEEQIKQTQIHADPQPLDSKTIPSLLQSLRPPSVDPQLEALQIDAIEKVKIVPTVLQTAHSPDVVMDETASSETFILDATETVEGDLIDIDVDPEIHRTDTFQSLSKSSPLLNVGQATATSKSTTFEAMDIQLPALTPLSDARSSQTRARVAMQNSVQIPTTSLEALPKTIVAAAIAGQKATIQIDPPELGRIQLDYVFDQAGKTQITLTPETDAGRAALAERLPAIFSLFEAQSLGEVEIELLSASNFGEREFAEHMDGKDDQEHKSAEAGKSSDLSSSSDTKPSDAGPHRRDGYAGTRLHMRV